jgi:hypothetical protein
MEAGFHCAFGAPYNLGNFRHGEILEKMQDRGLAAPESELIQGLMEGGGILSRERWIG